MDDSRTLRTVIEAEDKTSAAFASVEKKLGGLTGKLKDMAPAFKGMAVAGTAAFVGLGAAVKVSVDAAAEAAKVQAQLGAVLKSTGGIAGVTADAAIELSKALQKQTVFGDEAILSAENVLLTFTKVGKDVFPKATEAALDMATALGTDASSAASTLGRALQDPIAGTSTLRRMGVLFTDAQEEVIKKLVETGQTAEAQRMILEQLGTQFGGSASAAADTFGGKMEQMKERLGDVQEAIGTALIPALTRLLETIAPVIEKVIDWTEKNPELTAKIIMAAGAIAGLVAVLGTVGLVLPAVIGGVTALGTALAFLAANPIAIVIVALVAMTAAIVKAAEAYRGLKKDAEAAMASGKAAADIAARLGGVAAQTEDPARRAQLEALQRETEAAGARAQKIGGLGILGQIGLGLGLLNFDGGGTVPGPEGSAHLAVVHGGERVLTPDEAAGGMVFNFYGDVNDKDALIRAVVEAINRKADLGYVAGHSF